MSFLELGNYYWVLTPEEYNILSDLMSEYVSEYGGASFLDDFQLIDGTYYANTSSIDEDEEAFLEDWRLLNPFYYILSGQMPGDL